VTTLEQFAALRSPAGESAVTIVPLPFTGAAQEFEICH